ncbi:unnamed protein product [Adineta steineri]|uniref:Uncharacterized protein n=1 Tax=Adineta steineri TaxID=433720 RepID=A0A813WL57_9BILA|nr:unnamed protein product [Adineta steineri]CAF1390124.1 unnamed protein product [Adineta steineri]
MSWYHILRLIPTIYAILIIITITCIFTRGFTNIHLNLIDKLYSFDYPRTYVELYFLMLFDSFVLIFSSFVIFLFKRCQRFKYFRVVLIIFQLITYVYSLSKFLVFYEWTNVRNATSPYQFDRFDYLAIIFIPLFALGGIFIWIIFFRIINIKHTDPERQLLINEPTRSYTEEIDPLLVEIEDGSTKSTKNENKDLKIQIKETSGLWWRIIKLGKQEWKLYIIGFCSLLIAASSNFNNFSFNQYVSSTIFFLAEMFQPYFSGEIISCVVDKNWHKFLTNIFWYLGISVIFVITSGLRGFIFSITLTNLIQRLRDTVFTRILKQDIEFFDETKTGEITSRLASDITTVSEAVSLNLNIFLRSTVQTIGTIIMMLVLSWNLFLLVLITGPLAFGTGKLYGDLMANQQKKVQDALAESNSLAEEAIATIRTVKSFANEDEEIRLFHKKNDLVRKFSIRQALYYFGYLWNGQILIVLLNLGTLAYGGHLVMNNRLSVSNFVSFILYQQRLGDALDAINGVYADLMKASGASVKLFEYIDRIPKITNNGIEKPNQFQGRIEFKNVSFAFPNRKNDKVLKNISFTVQPGEQVALVGPSGSGKTTCISLLEHFYEADEGEILIDGIPVQNYDYKFYHEKVSLVSQEPVLHARSIRDNIQYGLIEKKPQEEIELVSQMANAHLFISQFQCKYDTECGERGVQMAGGQKQRIALARALIRSPNVLLLDEATSALDAEAEAQVQEAIARTVIGRTVLVIAHRLSTIRNANKILVLQYGEIVEEGTHIDLMRKRGLYYQLVKRQTEQNEIEIKDHSIHHHNTNNNTTMLMDVPLTDKKYSTSFNAKDSI